MLIMFLLCVCVSLKSTVELHIDLFSLFPLATRKPRVTSVAYLGMDFMPYVNQILLLVQYHSFALLLFSASRFLPVCDMAQLTLLYPASLSHLEPLQHCLHVCFILPCLPRAFLWLLVHKDQVRPPHLSTITLSSFKFPPYSDWHPRIQTLISWERDAYWPSMGQVSTLSSGRCAMPWVTQHSQGSRSPPLRAQAQILHPGIQPP